MALDLKDWSLIVKDEIVYTGGGCDYYVTIIRKGSRQIEVINDFKLIDSEKPFRVNIGYLCEIDNPNFEPFCEEFDFIEGDYNESREFNTKEEALKFVQSFIHDDGKSFLIFDEDSPLIDDIFKKVQDENSIKDGGVSPTFLFKFDEWIKKGRSESEIYYKIKHYYEGINITWP